MTPQTLGANIRAQRNKRGISMKKLGEQVGCSESHIWHIENGDKPGVPFRLIYDISKVLKISLNKLCE